MSTVTEIYVPDKSQPPMKISVDVESQLLVDENSTINQPSFKALSLPILSVNPNETSSIVENMPLDQVEKFLAIKKSLITTTDILLIVSCIQVFSTFPLCIVVTCLYFTQYFLIQNHKHWTCSFYVSFIVYMVITDMLYFLVNMVFCSVCLLLGQQGLILLLINSPMILTLCIVEIVQFVYLIKSCYIPSEVRSFAYYYEKVDKLELKKKELL